MVIGSFRISQRQTEIFGIIPLIPHQFDKIFYQIYDTLYVRQLLNTKIKF